MVQLLTRLSYVLLLLGMFGVTQCGSPTITEEFTCGEKRFCAEMTSCAEARFYLKKCGVTTMDGDSDGVPCEVEHCTSG